MATSKTKLSLTIKPRKGQRSAGARAALEAIKEAIRKQGVDLFGGDFEVIARQAEFGKVKTGTFSNLFKLSKPPDFAGKAELGAAYATAWRNRYRKFEQQGQSDRWQKWKSSNTGRYPYSAGSHTISRDDSAHMTNYLYTSVGDALTDLKDTRQVQFGNVLLTGGLVFDPDQYPKRVKPYKGYRRTHADGSSTGAWYDTISYVRRYMYYLHRAGLINANSNLGGVNAFLQFERQDWNKIALIMQRIIQAQFIDPLADYFEDNLKIEVL